MGGLSAPAGQDSLGGEEPVNVLRLRFLPNQNHLLAELPNSFRLIGVEDGLPGGGPRRGGKAGEDRLPLEVRIDPLVEELLQFLRFQPEDGLVFFDQLLGHHLLGRSDNGLGVHLSVSCLQDIEGLLFNGELEILNFVKMLFQGFPDPLKFPVRLWHFLFHLLDGLGRSDACDDVLPLGIRY